ncbi:hypothetical protein CHN56_03408 [Bacillus velezensis]|nr:hypothetical protein CHN56_03408 [Bacillus velezensis]ATC50298.1 hypothetical protein CLI97_00964 [Bacillus velezensis]MCW5192963.1 hypothetical protein [Bacillus amyloliquefaciens]
MARQLDELDKIYNTASWKRVRKVVLVRDGYLCCECCHRGLVTEANTVHHSIALRDEVINDLFKVPQNGATGKKRWGEVRKRSSNISFSDKKA